MHPWIARTFAVLLAIAAVYLVMANAQAPQVLLESTLGAALLAIATIAVLWRRPQAAALLNAVWIVGAFVASASLSANHQLPTLMASSLAQTPAGAGAPVSPEAAVSNSPADTMTAAASPLPSMKPASGALSAPQPGSDYSYFLGPATIDDGMSSGEAGKATAAAVGKVAELFSNGPPPSQSPQAAQAQALRDADAKLPESEYSLTALAATLPSDPIAIYKFVRDNIDVDGYDGVMRGPLGTWMTRAGSPSDKLVLMAWLMVNKGIPLQFVRGTLSTDEQGRVEQAVAAPPVPPQPFDDPQASAAAARYVHDGSTFATWAVDQLGKAHQPIGRGAGPSIGTRHYWLQVDSGGKVLDLDPTLSTMNEGQHLGTLDSSFTPWAILPDDEWHYVQIRTVAEFADGTTQSLGEVTAKVPYLAYAPIRVAVIPHGASDFSNVASARTFDVITLAGGDVKANATLDLGAHGGVRGVRLEMRRKDTNGTILTSSRDLLPPDVPAAAQGPTVAGLTTMLLVPGSGANVFMLHEYFKVMAVLADAVAKSTNGKPQPVPLYPFRIGDYFSRDDLVATALFTNSGTRFYRARPNIALQRTWFSVANGGAPVWLNGFDIVDNAMAAAAGVSEKTAQANLARGYADTQIEREVSVSKDVSGTIAIFDAAKNSGVAPVVLTSAGAVPQAVAPLARGIDGTFAEGNVAIALANSVTLGGSPAYAWWDIDPASGNAVGRITGGGGESMTSYGYILRTISTGLWVAEMAQAAHECYTGSGDCLQSTCEALVASIMGRAAWKHALHVHSMNTLAAAVAVVVVGEFVGGQALGSMCGAQGGGGGGEGGGGGGGH